MDLLLLCFKNYFSIKESLKEKEKPDDEFKKDILDSMHFSQISEFIMINEHIKEEGEKEFFARRTLMPAYFLACSLPFLPTVIIPVIALTYALVERFIIKQAKIANRIASNNKLHGYDINRVKIKHREYDNRVKFLRRMRSLKQAGKTHEEIMRTIEIDREIDNSIELDYQVRCTHSKEELAEKLNNRTLILNKKTPLLLSAALNHARSAGKFDSIYKIDPRHLTEDDIHTIEKKTSIFVRYEENRPFYDYQYPVREVKPVDERDYIKHNVYLPESEALYDLGVNYGLVKEFPADLIEGARTFYDEDANDSIPIAFKLLIPEFSVGKCYPYSSIVEEILRRNGHNVRREKGIIDQIELNPYAIEDTYTNELERDMHGVHYYVVETMENGTEWVYDTAMNLMIEKNLFYAYNRVRDVSTVEFSSMIRKKDNGVIDDNTAGEEDTSVGKEPSREEAIDRCTKLCLFLSKEEEYLEGSRTPNLLRREFETCKQEFEYEKLIDALGIREEIEVSHQKSLGKAS